MTVGINIVLHIMLLYMVTGQVNLLCDHFAVDTYAESLCYIPENNKMVYVNYTSIKK